MSKPDTTPTDAAAPDPHGLLVDTEYDSMREAQRNAKRAGEVQAQPRCPDCASTNLSKKAGATARDPDHKVDTAYRCVACGAHFDDPAPSVNDEEPEHCAECGRALHVRATGPEHYRCHRCDVGWRSRRAKAMEWFREGPQVDPEPIPDEHEQRTLEEGFQ
jgi:DNA-directed RNA polymerase subunit RPC12/RpoP